MLFSRGSERARPARRRRHLAAQEGTARPGASGKWGISALLPQSSAAGLRNGPGEAARGGAEVAWVVEPEEEETEGLQHPHEGKFRARSDLRSVVTSDRT